MAIFCLILRYSEEEDDDDDGDGDDGDDEQCFSLFCPQTLMVTHLWKTSFILSYFDIKLGHKVVSNIYVQIYLAGCKCSSQTLSRGPSVGSKRSCRMTADKCIM